MCVESASLLEKVLLNICFPTPGFLKIGCIFFMEFIFNNSVTVYFLINRILDRIEMYGGVV
jgi:hypothetical protein